MGSVLESLTTGEVRRLMKDLERESPIKYSRQQDERKRQLDRLLGLLGPLGEAVRTIIHQEGTPTEDAYRSAVELIRAFGGEVLHPEMDPERGRKAATEFLDGHDLQEGDLAGPRGSIGYDIDETARLVEREIRVSSSNVYSFVFERTSRRSGILYVTFLAWTPEGGKMRSPGPTYAYYDVPVIKYESFKRAAAQSAGKAVWDYLRVRGSVSDHQHDYRLVAATLVQQTGEFYIPRKVTQKGYKTRNLPAPGVGRRSAMRSTLPPREFVNRGGPNRGRPNTGR
jgi:hypothetical protein